MLSLTENESRIINFLIRNFSENYSIRDVARKNNVSAMGAQKILKSLEAQNIVKKEKVSTSIFYKLSFKNSIALKLAELVLAQKKMPPLARVYEKNLNLLKKSSKACILYGSILKDNKPKDVDIMLIIDKKNFNKIEKYKHEIEKIAIKKIHILYQTEKDFKENIKKRDKTILDIIKTGAVLWGENKIVNCIKNDSE